VNNLLLLNEILQGDKKLALFLPYHFWLNAG